MKTYWMVVTVLTCVAPKSNADVVISFAAATIQADWGPPQYAQPDHYGASCTPANGTTCTAGFNLNLTDINNVTRNYQGASTLTIDAGYGHIFLRGTINTIALDPTGFHSRGAVESHVYFTDSITIFAPPGAPQRGLIFFGWDCGPNPFCPEGDVIGANGTGDGSWTSGTPVFFSADEFIRMQNGFGAPCGPLCPTDAMTSIVLDKIAIMDSSGVPLSGFTYLTGSSTAYSVAGGTQVPEPSAALLVGCGVLLCILRLCQPKRTSVA
jgi:hypothetical protein